MVAVETERLQTLRAEVAAGQWRVKAQGVNGYDELLHMLGKTAGVEGLAQLFSYQLQPFDWANMEKNKVNVVMAMLASLRPKSSDGIFHLNKAEVAGVIFLKENVVEFHQMTGEGLRSGILVRVNSANDAGMESSYDGPVL